MTTEKQTMEDKDLAAEFTKLIESGVELDEKSARELLNKILSSK